MVRIFFPCINSLSEEEKMHRYEEDGDRACPPLPALHEKSHDEADLFLGNRMREKPKLRE